MWLSSSTLVATVARTLASSITARMRSARSAVSVAGATPFAGAPSFATPPVDGVAANRLAPPKRMIFKILIEILRVLTTVHVRGNNATVGDGSAVDANDYDVE
jgi:hypothetical protein